MCVDGVRRCRLYRLPPEMGGDSRRARELPLKLRKAVGVSTPGVRVTGTSHPLDISRKAKFTHIIIETKEILFFLIWVENSSDLSDSPQDIRRGAYFIVCLFVCLFFYTRRHQCIL